MRNRPRREKRSRPPPGVNWARLHASRAQGYVCDSLTYVPSPLAAENRFLTMTPDRPKLPTFAESSDKLPEPFWAGHQDATDCYRFAWERVFAHLRQPTPENGFVANYLETAFEGHLFMWDSAFSLQYAKYGMRAFDFLRTLDNLYCKQHRDGFICREIDQSTGLDCFHRHDPAGTGPNVMAWTEWDYYRQFGDRQRLELVYPVLLAYHLWLKAYRTWPDGTYWYTGFASGLDNQPRPNPEDMDPSDRDALTRFRWLRHGHMVWVDACIHQIISARTLARMAKVLGRTADIAGLEAEAELLTRYVNRNLWDGQTAYYYDRYRDGRRSQVMSIVAYWALLAGIVPASRRARFVAHLSNTRQFNRRHRVPSLAANHPEYDPRGRYWCGGVWPPTNYMVLRGLTEAGFHGLAHEIGRNHVENVVRVWQKTGQVWENYVPDAIAPGNESRPDLVGWSALGPIAVLIEHVLGVQAHPDEGRLAWNISLLEEHGVRNYPFGAKGTVTLECGRRKRESEAPKVKVRSDVPVTVEITWNRGTRRVVAG